MEAVNKFAHIGNWKRYSFKNKVRYLLIIEASRSVIMYYLGGVIDYEFVFLHGTRPSVSQIERNHCSWITSLV